MLEIISLKPKLEDILLKLEAKLKLFPDSRIRGTLSAKNKLEELIKKIKLTLETSKVRMSINLQNTKFKELLQEASLFLDEKVNFFEPFEPKWKTGTVEEQTKKAEDAPPLLLNFKDQNDNVITILGVADGLGGSGGRLAFGGHSHAHYASRTALEAVKNCLKDDKFCQAVSSTSPEAQSLVSKTIFDEFIKITKSMIAKNATELEKNKSRIRGTIILNFPTTLSLAVIVRQPDGQKFLVNYTVGDSPIVIMDKSHLIKTINYEIGSGDKPMGKGNVLSYDDDKLNFQVNMTNLNGGETVFCSTDWITKLGFDSNIMNPEIYSKLLEGQTPEAIRKYYSGEIDDATVAYSEV